MAGSIISILVVSTPPENNHMRLGIACINALAILDLDEKKGLCSG
jgi:hypothetical protein